MGNELLVELAAVADPHLRWEREHPQGLTELELASRWAAGTVVGSPFVAEAMRRGASLKGVPFFVLGDLFDSPRPRAELLTHAIRAFRQRSIRVLPGNHDIESYAQRTDRTSVCICPGITLLDTALGSSDGAGFDAALDERRVFQMHGVEVVTLAGKPEQFLPALRLYAGAQVPTVVMAHLGIADDDTPAYLQHDAVHIQALTEALEAMPYVRAVLVGHWHMHRQWTIPRANAPACEVVQVGALVPTGWDNPGVPGYGHIVRVKVFGDHTEVDTAAVVTGPRYINATCVADVETALGDILRECALHIWQHSQYDLRIRAVGESAEAATQVEQAIRVWAAVNSSQMPSWSIAPHVLGGRARAKEQAAVQALRGVPVLEEELAAYVAGLKLPDTLKPAAVIDRCRGFLEV